MARSRSFQDSLEDSGSSPWGSAPWPERAKRWGIILGGSLLGLLVLAFIVRAMCFHYVDTEEMLVIVSKTGENPTPGKILVDEGEKGIQREVRGEGWHFVMPVLYRAEVHKIQTIPPGEVGIVTNLGGELPENGRVLVDSDAEKGVRRQVLLPGAYRLNPYGYKVTAAKAVEIKPGFVGVVRRKLAGPSKVGETIFGEDGQHVGILDTPILQPGIYYLNTREYEVIPREVGVYQTSFRYTENSGSDTSLEVKGKDGYYINMECTIEWELQPKDAPHLFAIYREVKNIEMNVVDQQARTIALNRGLNYGAEDWLDGEKRETYQADFKQQLEDACKAHRVHVRSAFIRNIIIPDRFLKAKRDRQLAIESKTTSEARALTEKSNAEVEKAMKAIDIEVGIIEGETEKIVALVEQDIANLKTQNEAELRKLKAEYEAKIAKIKADTTRTLGQADAESVKLKETAKSNIYKLKMDVFQSDSDAFLKYNVSQQLNPELRLRVFHSGPGTFWTNMEGKNTSLLLPTPGTEAPRKSFSPVPSMPRQP